MIADLSQSREARLLGPGAQTPWAPPCSCDGLGTGVLLLFAGQIVIPSDCYTTLKLLRSPLPNGWDGIFHHVMPPVPQCGVMA